MRQVHIHAVTVVSHERAARATLLPPRNEHEMLHQQLPATFEQFSERAPPLGRVENVVLIDAHPRESAALAGYLVAQARQLLFVRQQRLALGSPFVPGYDAMVFGAYLLNPGSAGHGRSHRFGSFLRLSSRFSILLVVGCREKHLAPAIETGGVTNVTGFRWTR